MKQYTIQDYIRSTDPATSRDAAASVLAHLPAMQTEVLAYLSLEPMSAYEIWLAMRPTHPKVQQSSIARRLTDLARAGHIEPTGGTRPGATGRQLQVYRIAPAGTDYLAAS